MAWFKRKQVDPEMAKKTAGLSGGSKTLDAEQQQQSRDRMEKELADRRSQN